MNSVPLAFLGATMVLHSKDVLRARPKDFGVYIVAMAWLIGGYFTLIVAVALPPH